MAFVNVARREDLWSGEMVGTVVQGVRVLLINLDDTIYAYEDRCSHQGVPLSSGRLSGTVITCSAHEWQYDACTGQGLNPRKARLRALPLLVEGEQILVDVAGG